MQDSQDPNDSSQNEEEAFYQRICRTTADASPLIAAGMFLFVGAAVLATIFGGIDSDGLVVVIAPVVVGIACLIGLRFPRDLFWVVFGYLAAMVIIVMCLLFVFIITCGMVRVPLFSRP